MIKHTGEKSRHTLGFTIGITIVTPIITTVTKTTIYYFTFTPLSLNDHCAMVT